MDFEEKIEGLWTGYTAKDCTNNNRGHSCAKIYPVNYRLLYYQDICLQFFPHNLIFTQLPTHQEGLQNSD